MIEGVNRVLVDVDDQDRAKAFWTDKLGFEVEFDESFAGERWVELRPPNGSPILVLVPRRAEDEVARAPDGMPTSNLFFTSDDIEASYQTLTQRGVHFPTPPSQQHFGWWSVFEDSEGNRFALSVTSRDHQ